MLTLTTEKKSIELEFSTRCLNVKFATKTHDDSPIIHSVNLQFGGEWTENVKNCKLSRNSISTGVLQL